MMTAPSIQFNLYRIADVTGTGAAASRGAAAANCSIIQEKNCQVVKHGLE